MLHTFANLPLEIEHAISSILSKDDSGEWLKRAEILHALYMDQNKKSSSKYIKDYSDALAYLGLRVPATYAQIFGALSQVQEIIPSFNPKSLLDIGTGPGTGIWAAKEIWKSLEFTTCIDQDDNFLSLNKEILQKASVSIRTSFRQEGIRYMKNDRTTYDVVLIANILNELSDADKKDLLQKAYASCSGVLIIIEPGTSLGVKIINEASGYFSGNAPLLAPYINNSYVESKEYWIHFSQRFIRPEFQRRLRQSMRESNLMASDWEETKYAYVAIGKIPPENKSWGRVIGPTKKQKGFLEVPILTSDGINQIKVLKRNKNNYLFAKNLRWGECIKDSKDLIDQE